MHAAAAAAAGVVAPSAAWVSRQRRLAARDGATQVRVEWHAASRGVTSISITTWHDNDKTFKRKTAGCQQEGAGRRRASQPLRAAQEEGPRAASDAARVSSRQRRSAQRSAAHHAAVRFRKEALLRSYFRGWLGALRAEPTAAAAETAVVGVVTRRSPSTSPGSVAKRTRSQTPPRRRGAGDDEAGAAPSIPEQESSLSCPTSQEGSGKRRGGDRPRGQGSGLRRGFFAFG